MGDNTSHPWGVPQDAPPPRKRSTWGTDKGSAPAARGTGGENPSVNDEAPVTPVGEDQVAWFPAPGVDVDLAGFHAGTTPAEDAVVQPVTVEAHEPVDTSAEDAFGGDFADLFGDPDEDVAPPPVLTAPEPAEDLPDLFTEPPAPQPVAVHDDLPDLFNDDYLPAVPVEGADLPAEASHGNVPATLDQATTTPASYGTSSDAMTAWHAMRSQAAAAAQAQAPRSQEWVADQELADRYMSAERLSDIVDQVLGLAQSGNPRLQGIINNFRLTRDHDVDAAQRAAYEAVMGPAMAENLITVSNPRDFKPVLDIAYDELIGVGPLGPLWRDDSVTEILVSGPDNVTCERDGALVKTPVKFRDLEHLRKTARDLAARVDDRTVSRSNPLVTAQLPGARVQFALAPVAPVAGVSITIRKFRPLFGLDDLLAFGALTEEMAAFLSDAVAARATILVSGGTGSGKTTMINAMSAFIPDTERVITIEDALELSLTNTHVESLLTKELASGDDKVVIGQDELLRATLRMRPDRIIVGEIRDGSGCATMLQAANTGHDGTMTTVHANNPDRALRRLSQLLRTTSDNMGDELASEEVRMAFDLIVQVVRVRGRRFVSAISLVNKDSEGTVPVFVGSYGLGETAPVFRRVGGLGSDTEMAQRFLDAGMDPDPWG